VATSTSTSSVVSSTSTSSVVSSTSTKMQLEQEARSVGSCWVVLDVNMGGDAEQMYDTSLWAMLGRCDACSLSTCDTDVAIYILFVGINSRCRLLSHLLSRRVTQMHDTNVIDAI